MLSKTSNLPVKTLFEEQGRTKCSMKPIWQRLSTFVEESTGGLHESAVRALIKQEVHKTTEAPRQTADPN